jgi:DNA-binding response OmpR family regulator
MALLPPIKQWFSRSQPEGTIPTTILVVTDDPDGLSPACELLSNNGYDVRLIVAHDEALALLDSEARPGLLIGDFVKPEVDGKNLLDRVRIRFGRAGLPPVLFLVDSREDEQVAGSYDAADILPKPFEGQMLLARIQAILPKNGALTA